MFNFFKKKKEAKRPPMLDLDQNPLQEGDLVECLRYEMGLSKVLKTEEGLIYESVATGKRESWIRMIDASTEFQKVKKVTDQTSDDNRV